MKLKIEIKMDNDAFAENARVEVARILGRYARELEEGRGMERVLMDANGNRVGNADVEGEGWHKLA